MSPSAPGTPQTRRAITAGLAAALAAPSAFAAGAPKIITMLGDSITAGYGLAAAAALPAQLQAALARLGVKVQVRAAGVSGDTTTDALARVDFSVRPDTDLCLVAVGGNDLLQGVDPRRVQASLTAILRRLKARRIRAAIAGMQAPAAIGGGYARDFNAVFPAVARTGRVPLYPFLLSGAAGNRALLQRDAIHPNAAGVKVIAARMAPFVAKALAAR